MKHLAIFFFLFFSFAFASQLCQGADPPGLHEGYWIVMFGVSPDCPACEDAIAWLGRASGTSPQINSVLLCPWLTDELETSANAAQLRIFVDAGGQLGDSLGVEQAPTVVFLLDREELGRLDWPFTEDELVQGIEELGASQRSGPWANLGEGVSLGPIATLRAGSMNLDNIPSPWLLSFYSPLCPACQNGVPALTQLSREIRVVLAVVNPDSLSLNDHALLNGPELRVVLDDTGDLARNLDVRVTPTHMLIDEDGKLSWIQEGILKAEQLQDVLHIALGDEEIEQEN